MGIDMDALFIKAREAAARSYSPYSRFRVGAALLSEDGRIFVGTNVENRSFGLTVCAERSAVSAAIVAGARRFVAIAVSTPDSRSPVGPCGACRQVLSEFLDPSAPVRFGGEGGDGGGLVDTTIGELLPLDSLHDLAGGKKEEGIQ
ncbi:MAG: cytidine deaminase [Treponema sp. RIFOXYC1_FULL_61_9]|nr:MAG: cytidine deaminase [Treponema sp. RIFOXYC1_FULL_61_9]